MAYCVPDDVKARARITPGIPDADDAAIASAIAAAAVIVDTELDRAGGVPIDREAWITARSAAVGVDEDEARELLKLANVQVALELMRRPPFGVVGVGDAGPLRVSSNPAAGIAGLLFPLSEQWGIA